MHWSDGWWREEFEDLGRSTPVAIVQLLPKRLWVHTTLGPTTRTAVASLAGSPNRRLRLIENCESCLMDDGAAVPFPVLTLEPDRVKRWAEFLMARPGSFADCVLLRG